jgi:hypothetical protein
LGAAHFPQVQVHRRETLAKRENRLGNGRVERRRRGEADLQFTQLTQLRTPGHIRRFVDLGQHQPRLFEEQSTGLAQLDPTIGAFEQPRAHLLLQRLNLLAQRWLRDAQHLGGAAEMQFFGDGDEVAQMTQFHGFPLGRKSYQTGRTIYWIESLASYMLFHCLTGCAPRGPRENCCRPSCP